MSRNWWKIWSVLFVVLIVGVSATAMRPLIHAWFDDSNGVAAAEEAVDAACKRVDFTLANKKFNEFLAMLTAVELSTDLGGSLDRIGVFRLVLTIQNS